MQTNANNPGNYLEAGADLEQNSPEPTVGRDSFKRKFRPALSAKRPEHFSRGDHLAHVALRVVCHMNERAADGRWQLFSADGARRVEVGCRQHANAIGGAR